VGVFIKFTVKFVWKVKMIEKTLIKPNAWSGQFVTVPLKVAHFKRLYLCQCECAADV
jgi:hypothetical protein